MGGAARLVALDIDPKNGGDESLSGLAELPDTLTQITGSGGQHRIFRVPDKFDITKIRNRTSAIAPGLDVRTEGGQIVAAPSVSAIGEYRWLDLGSPVAELPEWLYRLMLEETDAGSMPTDSPMRAVSIPTRDSVERARNYIAKMDAAISGSGGHPQTFKVSIALVRGFNLDHGTALSLLREFNERCQPKWTEKELRHKIQGALKAKFPEFGYIINRPNPNAPRDRDPMRIPVAPPRATETVGPIGPPEPTRAPKPEVWITLDQGSMVDDACKHLAAIGNVYQRARRLVQVHESRFGVETHIVGKGHLVTLLTQACDWIKAAPMKDADVNLPEDRKVIVNGESMKRVECPPAPNVVGAIFDMTEWPHIQHLDGLSESPFIREDGTIVQDPGYDAMTRTLYRPSVEYPPIDPKPDVDAVKNATAALLEIVKDFPFVAQVDKASWLAAVLTMIARPAIDGPTPCFAVNGNKRAAGKGLLCDVAILIANGREPAHAPYQRKEEEQVKSITAHILAARQAVVVDNVDGMFGSPTWNVLFTARSWDARLLGTNESPMLPTRTVWWVTGNNLTYYRDTPRRIIQMRLRSHEERPEDRDLPDLIQVVKEKRPQLVAAALTILLASSQAVPAKLRPWTYKEWSNVVRRAIAFIGLGEIIGNTEINDADAEDLTQLHEAWLSLGPSASHEPGVTAARALEIVKENPEQVPLMVQWLADTFEGKPATARTLGNIVAKRRDAVGTSEKYGKLMFLRGDKRTEYGYAWRVVNPPETADGQPTAVSRIPAVSSVSEDTGSDTADIPYE
jgi:hypothetical protein